MIGAYRDGSLALDGRRRELRARVSQLDDEVPASKRRQLPRTLQRRLGELRGASEPGDDSLQSLVQAEQAVEHYERRLDEALGLAADLRRAVDPVLPRKEVLAKWTCLFGLSMALMVAVVHQLGLDDFMLRAFGVTSLRASADIPVSRIAYEAQPPPAMRRLARLPQPKASRSSSIPSPNSTPP